MKLIKSLLFLSLIIMSCKEQTNTKEYQVMSFNEEQLYRPNFHFTPQNNWMNDPNGMFYLDGEYHLFFQYYPEDNIWGPMHWGHAISNDLITWKELPIALYPDDLGYIFSGSAVVDINNTSGFGKDGKTPIIAMFTYHDAIAEKEGKIDYQTQGIAYSLDKGRTWTKYSGNPVLPNPGIKDFRDPKIYWDQDHNQWLMTLATYEKTFFYSSKDLKNWDLLSDFGEFLGNHDGVWECPDFFPISINGTDTKKWVLLQSINPGHINGGSGTQYFVGDFDGKTFKLDTIFQNQLEKKEAIWLDFGRDNYAGVTWSNIPKEDGRKLFIGWMSNWEYAQQVPTKKWRSAMTTARTLELELTNNQYFLTSKPVKELNTYLTKISSTKDVKLIGNKNIINNNSDLLSKASVYLKISELKQDVYTLKLSNSKNEVVEFGLNNIDNNVFIDRSKSGDLSFSNKFANSVSKATLDETLTEIDIHILIDKTSVEIFYNNGTTVMTEIFFPSIPFENLDLSTKNKSTSIIKTLEISQINSK